MKKKYSALALALILTLSACGGKDSDAPNVPETGVPEVTEPAAPGEAGPPETTEPSTPGEAGADIDLAAFYDTLRAENTWPELMNLTEDPTMTELLDSYYPGLSELAAKQCGVYIAAISAAVGEIALVETENAGDAQKAAEIFQARIDYQVGDDANPGGAWYPETIEGWKTKSHVVSNGNFVMLAVGDSAAAVESFENLFA